MTNNELIKDYTLQSKYTFIHLYNPFGHNSHSIKIYSKNTYEKLVNKGNWVANPLLNF